MPIRQYLADRAAFGPDTIAAMSKAFDEACIALQVFAADEKGREIVATRIIDLARDGLVDPNALRDRVVSEAVASAIVPRATPRSRQRIGSASPGLFSVPVGVAHNEARGVRFIERPR